MQAGWKERRLQFLRCGKEEAKLILLQSRLEEVMSFMPTSPLDPINLHFLEETTSLRPGLL